MSSKWRLYVVFLASMVSLLVLCFNRTKFTVNSNDDIIHVHHVNAVISTMLPPNTSISTSLESEKWAPIALTKCERKMKYWMAPCIAARDPLKVHSSEELLYPDFSISLPGFVDAEARQAFLSFIGGIQKDSRSYYLGQTGQNFVLNNVSFDPKRSGLVIDPIARGNMYNWCSEPGAPHKDLFKLANSNPGDFSPDVSSALLVFTPLAGTFQHFLDRASHVIEQASHWIDKDATWFVVQRDKNTPESVPRLLQRFGYRNELVQDPGKSFAASRLIYSCRAPLIHPYYTYRFIERLGIQQNIALNQRKVVLLMSRHGLSRQLRNEKDLSKEIENLLEQRGQNESLVNFSEIQNAMPFDELTRWLNENVRAMVGAHGGAFYNHRFCGPGTLVIELMPSNRIFTRIWEEARLLGQNHWLLLYPDLNKGEISSNTTDVVAILAANLGKMPDTPTLRLEYPWKQALDDLPSHES